MDDLETTIFEPLPDETWVYPGRGKDTTLGRVRPSTPEWRARRVTWVRRYLRSQPDVPHIRNRQRRGTA